ncbi:unnamed protein product [Mucor hiemalis]
MFSSQVFQEGQMHFQFITHWTREHAELEDFQPHRRIFGVIGIMDCQEWKDKDLNEGYKKFAKDLNKYPTAVATRCFAFDPSETQEDDTKGLIMIPNVGNMSFYMSTMICDFASEILEQFASLAKRIETLSSLESPLPTSMNIPSRNNEPVPQNNRYSQPPISVTPSNSTNMLKRSSLQPTINTSNNNTFHNLSGTTGETIRTKKRTPGRIRKILGDFYLLAGRLPDAVNHYDQAIEMAKMTSDYLWLGSAMEGWVSATVLLEYLQADIGHIVSRNPISPEPNPEAESENTPPLTPSSLGPRSTLNVIVEMYGKVLNNYSRVGMTANFPVPDLVYAETCLKIARVLTTAYLNNGWNEHTLSLIIEGKVEEKEGLEKLKHEGSTSFITTKDLLQFKKSGIPRHDIAEWVTKVWEIHMNDLALLDQIYLTTSMSSIYSLIGYHRKAAWMMQESVGHMLPLLIQHRRTGLSKDSKFSTSQDSGVLEILKRICEIYGIGERNVHDIGTLEDMRQEDGAFFSSNKKALKKGSTHHQKGGRRFGWPELQIDVLKQCISVSDALIDNGSQLYYTTVLLKNLYQYLPKAEQIKLATTIQGMVASSNHAAKKAATQFVVRENERINYWGVNIVSRVEAKRPISRKAVYAHPIKNEAVANAKLQSESPENCDPFIYNPFAKKIETIYTVVLVKDELSEFVVTLINPFGFDLELQNIILSTTGVAFNAVPAAVTIPANATLQMTLMGTPEATGTLVIRGCLVQITGFAEQEFLVDQEVKKSPEDGSNDTVVKIKHSGLKAIKPNRKQVIAEDASPLNFYQLSVIDDQPLLKIKTTSMMHGAVMLYEGEETHVTMELENIGNIAVDFITLSFTDSTTTNALSINPELPAEEQYEIELYTKGTRVFSWEGTSEKNSTDLIGKKIWLPKGATTTIKVSVFGKRDCHGGTIQVDYGYLDRTVLQADEILHSTESDADQVAATTFYTRQLYLNVMITVCRNLDPFNWDVVYLRHSTPAPADVLEKALENIQSQTSVSDISIVQNQPVEDLLLVTRNVGIVDQERNEFCLVTLDVRNIWTLPFDVDFSINNEVQNESSDKDHLQSRITIQPGSTSRIILPFKRLYLSSEICEQDIPSFDPNKQFVVSQGPKISKEQQNARLQMFWYREEVINRIKASWRCRSTGRSGELNLRHSLRLNAIQLGILKKEDVEFFVDLKGEHIKKLSHRRFSCPYNEYVHFTVSVRNRLPLPIKLILRLQPVQSYNDGVKEYDLSDKLLLEGVEQVVLPEISPLSGTLSHTFPLYFLSRGQFELLYHGEDVHTRKIYYDHEWAIIDVTEN